MTHDGTLIDHDRDDRRRRPIRPASVAAAVAGQ